jgi:hypothetical protein
MSALSHRDRVLTVLNHETPDRLPVDLGGCPAGGIGIQAEVPAENIVAMFDALNVKGWTPHPSRCTIQYPDVSRFTFTV